MTALKGRHMTAPFCWMKCLKKVLAWRAVPHMSRYMGDLRDAGPGELAYCEALKGTNPRAARNGLGGKRTTRHLLFVLGNLTGDAATVAQREVLLRGAEEHTRERLQWTWAMTQTIRQLCSHALRSALTGDAATLARAKEACCEALEDSPASGRRWIGLDTEQSWSCAAKGSAIFQATRKHWPERRQPIREALDAYAASTGTIETHHHAAGIGLMTPDQVHYGHAEQCS